MNFSELLREAIRSSGVELSAEDVDAVGGTVTELLQGWIAIHEPDDQDVDPLEPQRLLILQLLEELEDKVPIPVTEL